jgi:hypothetical protein
MRRKSTLEAGPLPVIRYTDMRARMQNETLASAPNYVAICVQHFTRVFYQPGLKAWLLRMRYANRQHFTHVICQPGLKAWLLRMRYANRQFKILPPRTCGTVVLTSINILRLNLNIPISIRFSVANTIIQLILRYSHLR